MTPFLMVNIRFFTDRQENEITGAISALDDGAEVDCGLTEEAVNLQTPLRAACAKVGVGSWVLGLGVESFFFCFFSYCIWITLKKINGSLSVSSLILIRLQLQENILWQGIKDSPWSPSVWAKSNYRPKANLFIHRRSWTTAALRVPSDYLT